MSHSASKLETELSEFELDEKVVGESSVGSSCRRVTLVRVFVVVLLARACLVGMGTLLVGLELFQSLRNWT